MLKVELKERTWALAQLDQIADGLRKTRDILDSHQMMAVGVQPIGLAMVKNFRGEGDMVGGWKSLSEYTQRIREERGYNGSNPILQQTGGLYQNAVVSLSRWPMTQANYSSMIQGSGQSMRVTGMQAAHEVAKGIRKKYETRAEYGGEPTFVNASASSRKWEAKITGPKAMHQSGGAIRFASESGWTNLPARPFWFFHTPALDESGARMSTLLLYRVFEGMPDSSAPSMFSFMSSRGY